MALKQSLNLKLGTRLSPQQIQLMKLLQLNTIALEQRIKEELEENPALEEGEEEEEEVNMDDEFLELKDDDEVDDDDHDFESSMDEEPTKIDDEITFDDYLDEADAADYKYEINNTSPDKEDKDIPFAVGPSFHDGIEQQLAMRDLTDHEYTIGLFLIGNMDDDGYIRRPAEDIVDDLAFTQNIISTKEEVDRIILEIQSLDPAGVGARNLQECLLIQLNRKQTKTREVLIAIDVVKHCMEEFSKKHYDKIIKKLNIEEEELKEVLTEITHLNPRPGNSMAEKGSMVGDVVPDFVINVVDGKLELSLNQRNNPELKISKEYIEMLQQYGKAKDKSSKEATTFVKSKIESAKWFIEALLQRYQTMLFCMNEILKHQEDFFLLGDETRLKPMILKDIADKTNLDISTVSRVANSKYVQTPYGTYLLKYFFSESLSTDSGEEVSSREVKQILSDCIGNENKRKPLTDDALTDILKEKGYNIARRTVAKYREMLEIPVARMRKEI